MKTLLHAVLSILVLAVSPAFGGTLPPDEYSRLTDSDILQAWSLANEACRHNPPACEERDAIDREMPARGYCYIGDGADAHWSKCDAQAPAAAPPQAAQAPSRPATILPPEPPGAAWRDDCLPGATPNMRDCQEADAPIPYGAPPFEDPPGDPYRIVEEERRTDMHAECARLRHTIFPSAWEAARARAACQGL